LGLGMKKVYLDSCFVIYLIETVEPFSYLARSFLSKNITSNFCVSPLVRMEVLVYPMRNHNDMLRQDYEDFLAELEMLPITDTVFERALQLRVAHGLKTPDALHLATAMVHGCQEFWTNDDRLSKVAGSIAVNIFSESGDVTEGGDQCPKKLES
jgi:predicted nucleic acid-binding protein